LATKHQEDIDLENAVELEKPRMMKVILLNDDYTSMDFVVEVLIEYFHKPIEEAINIMLKVHNEGSGICGVYPYDIAETKIAQVRREATSRNYPLRCIAQEI
jgi:ATP-dependent Clp protease adaptor protein ClpS